MALLLVTVGLLARPAASQTIEAITFDEAIRRATSANPGIEQAAAGILRAEALLQQVRSRSLPALDATFTTNIIDPVTEFAGSSINPRTQTTTAATFSAPILAPVRWAERAQAADQVLVAQAGAADVRRQVAMATAQAYLVIIAQRRVLELNERARENANAHFQYADQRLQGGLGSRLNMLRAQQELSAVEARVEDAQLAIRRAQEALGVLVAATGPVDAATEPEFDVSSELTEAGTEQTLATGRVDLRLALARQAAAARVLNDTWREYLPSVTALFQPQVLAPSGLFAQSRSWRASVVFSVPVFEFGQRAGLKRERQALLTTVQSEREAVERQASAEIRTAREAVRLTERALERARAAAAQAEEVLQITDVAFRAGATTNIEVVDAQRRARDAETTAAIAEDAVRRARLDLLVATGRFPQ
ncbi:MAG: TolC family protein [Vicinamibacterales bacterium]